MAIVVDPIVVADPTVVDQLVAGPAVAVQHSSFPVVAVAAAAVAAVADLLDHSHLAAYYSHH